MTRLPLDKLCHRCNTRYPCTREYWRDLDKDGEPVGDWCKKCRSPQGQAAWELERLKKENAREAVNALVATARANKMDCPDFTALTTTLVAAFGGPEALCQEIVQQVRAAKDGSRTRIEGLFGVVKMIDKVSGQVRKRVSDMTDMEILDELNDYAQRVLKPQLMLMPPDDVQRAATG